MTLRIKSLKGCLINKRFMGDIIFICAINKANETKQELFENFNTYRLVLKSKQISSLQENTQSEYLDIFR